jgi:hypothetical protein
VKIIKVVLHKRTCQGHSLINIQNLVSIQKQRRQIYAPRMAKSSSSQFFLLHVIDGKAQDGNRPYRVKTDNIIYLVMEIEFPSTNPCRMLICLSGTMVVPESHLRLIINQPDQCRGRRILWGDKDICADSRHMISEVDRLDKDRQIQKWRLRDPHYTNHSFGQFPVFNQYDYGTEVS